MRSQQDTPSLSVVIIGRNEGTRLIRCIQSVQRMRFPADRTEVIYVDTASIDGSAEKAAAMGANVLRLSPARPSAAISRNAGWRAARAPIILFLDGDTVLDPDFVSGAISSFDDPRIAIVRGHLRELHPESSVYIRVLDLDWVAEPGLVEFCGGNALVRRSVLEEVGGFDGSLIAGEEPEMCCRIRARGYQIHYLDLPMTGHDLAITTWRQYWIRSFRTGHAYAEVAGRFRGTETPLWQDEVKRTAVRGAFLILLLTVSLGLSLFLLSPVPAIVGAIPFFAMVLRTARKNKWKSSDPVTRLLYGIHSHIQQVPIFLGQLSYWFNSLSGRKQRLIEYKECQAPGTEGLSD